MAIITTQAFAQDAPRNPPGPPCLPHAEYHAFLSGKYQEQPQAMGMIGEGKAVMEIYASREGGTWTVLLTSPNGLSCMVASGDQWTGLKEPAL